jgi:hypothetical protein
MIYFVTETYLKVKTPITQNVDVNELTPFVSTVSDRRIQPICGTYFYDDLLTKYNAQTLSADETTLVEKIQPCIAWYAASQAVVALTYQLKNKGVQKQNGDFSESVSTEEVSFLYDHYQQQAAFYEVRLRRWLKDNEDLFANYTASANNDSDMKPDKTENTTGYTNNMMII